MLRGFFESRGLMEVETPLLMCATATDPNITSLETTLGPNHAPLYLQPSPEFAMKRLLAAGSGPIYQICKAFRRDESGRWHNPEFTIVEWYHPGLDYGALMDEVGDLIDAVLGPQVRRHLTYRDAFMEYLGVDPFETSTTDLQRRTEACGLSSTQARQVDRDGCLDLLFSSALQPILGVGVVCIHDFPASQAALAQIRHLEQTAERFEIFVNSVELANGYHELTDPHEQEQRMESDIRQRGLKGLSSVPIDRSLLGALQAGLPDCSGVALGFDRLLMLAEHKSALAEVLAFPLNGA